MQPGLTYTLNHGLGRQYFSFGNIRSWTKSFNQYGQVPKCISIISKFGKLYSYRMCFSIIPIEQIYYAWVATINYITTFATKLHLF